MSEVDGLSLWKILEQKGSDGQRQIVRTLVDYAAPILDRVIETFPTYTLHNREHARNVAGLMAKLLGDRMQDLNPLEAAFLILSAYWHDIGMVFKAEERARLTQEPEWADFLQSHAEAYLAIDGDSKGEPPVEIAEWYCRWRHADRVFIYMNHDAGAVLSFKWGVVDLREALGNLCRSHNEGISRIQANAVLKTDYRAGEADLRFCAILLRLADILDFDRTRSPEGVYQYLGLKRRADRRHEASDVEWQKHLAAEGFVFPEDRKPGYLLDFIAGPDHPAVEHDLRQFLDVIEREIEQCGALLTTCSKRWREFALPARIRRESIVANGYRYGEYRFSLDQDQVLDLLMGENLYDNPYVFVREMLQNALDASRLREHLERLRGDNDFKAQPIRVFEWLDRDRYHWVRFDDFGTGMDEQIIRDHLLKVGSSYYQSAQYRADILRASRGVGSDFVPISRFGIGLLSCFVLGDRIEISSLRQLPDGSRAVPVRLSMHGLHGFYTLQTPELTPTPMATADGVDNEEPGYRPEFGTSVAVRLDPRKEHEPLNLENLIKGYLVCPPVPVYFRGRLVGGDAEALVANPWCSCTRTEVVGLEPFAYTIKIDIYPIDITKRSNSSHVRGQGFVAYIAEVKSEDELFVHLTFEDGKLTVVTKRRKDLLWKDAPESKDAISLEMILSKESYLFVTDKKSRWLSYNGIAVPTTMATPLSDEVDRVAILNSDVLHEADSVVFALISIVDKHRPELSLGRDRLLELPWEVYSRTNLSIVQSSDKVIGRWLQGTNLFSPICSKRPLTVADLRCDPLLRFDQAWMEKCLFEDESGVIGLSQNSLAL